MDAAYAAILERGKFTWNQFWNGSPGCVNAFLEPVCTETIILPRQARDKDKETVEKGVLCRRSCCIDCPDPMVKNETCAADVRSLCRADSYAQKYAMVYGFSPGCGGNTSDRSRKENENALFCLCDFALVAKTRIVLPRQARDKHGKS
jgi:hypothetical protein